MRIVIDTNVLISSLISPGSSPAQVFEQWDKDVFTLLSSRPILNEYERVLWLDKFRPLHGFSEDEIRAVFSKLENSTEQIKVEGNLHVITDDPDDDKFLECATIGGAEFIVSGDHHLLNLKTFEDIEVLPPSAFLSLLDLVS